MTRHGGKKEVKRLNTAKFLLIQRKHGKYFVKARAGPHPGRDCLPLLHIVRDLLKIAENYHEAKKLITSGYFKVDGKVVKDVKFPVGLMDVLSIEKANKHYRILPHSHHKYILHEISEEESHYKLCRIKNKTTVKGGHVQLNLHDGRNVLIKVQDPKSPKEDIYKTMDVLKLSVPEQEILKLFKFKEGNNAIVISGLMTDIGRVGKIVKITKRFGPKASTTAIESENKEIVPTLYEYTFVIGEDKPEISLPVLDIN